MKYSGQILKNFKFGGWEDTDKEIKLDTESTFKKEEIIVQWRNTRAIGKPQEEE